MFDRKKKLLFIKLLMVFSRLWARDVTITIQDRDIELPLEGALIRSWDGSEHASDEDGKAVLSVPDDRQVIIQVSYPGYETGRLSIPISGDSFTLGLALGGAIESRELVIEAKRPGSSETKSGRSVAISGEAMERSSQIGLIEDVMTSIKLLPGVGYSGMFNAMPSIRGGDPGDLMSALDGFYIANPYHWAGGFSIFDPHMVASARLSHGVFSSRYGHTISGLLEVSSKKAAPDYAELEIGLSTSAVNLNAAIPLGSKGGLMLMGRVTYWDPFIWFLKQLSKVWDNERLKMVNAITTAPYIRSSAISFNYRINSELEITANAFVGADGMGADFVNDRSYPWVEYRWHGVFGWDNLQTFAIAGLTFNPRPSMVLRASAGAGYEDAKINANLAYDYLRVYDAPGDLRYELFPENLDIYFKGKQGAYNVQGRADFDWSLGKGFLFAAGLHELYSRGFSELGGKLFFERGITGPYFNPPLIIPSNETIYLHYPVYGNLPSSKNQQFNTSAYVLTEYTSPEKRFSAELGLRADHHYFRGEDFDIQTIPVLNPRLNLDFTLFKNRGIVESLGLTAGTGLFSSMNNALISIDPGKNVSDFELKPNRSWTTVLGIKSDFAGGWSFNLEGYFKYVFDRGYQYLVIEPGTEIQSSVLRFNGNGIIWGFDLMLQKFESRYWDGWLSYTFTHARYHEPEQPVMDKLGEFEDSGWYYPFFHRFHTLNLVLNFKPSKSFNIYTRLGLASGRPKEVLGKIESYDVYMLKDDGSPILDGSTGLPLKIKKFKRDTRYDDNSRTTWSIPLDIKLSYSIYNPRNKVLTEMYLAGENLASLVYVAQANTTFNQYTGQEDTGSDSANYEMPVPMFSVGVKWSF